MSSLKLSRWKSEAKVYKNDNGKENWFHSLRRSKQNKRRREHVGSYVQQLVSVVSAPVLARTISLVSSCFCFKKVNTFVGVFRFVFVDNLKTVVYRASSRDDSKICTTVVSDYRNLDNGICCLRQSAHFRFVSHFFSPFFRNLTGL